MSLFRISVLNFFILRSLGTSIKGVPRSTERPSQQNPMQLVSESFKNGERIPRKFTCEGENISPPLEILNVPAQAESLALVVHDGDAPVQGGWTHWVVFNIDPGTSTIQADSLPSGAVEGQTSFGKPGWGGPYPPSGTHHYEFRLYALDSKLSLDSKTKKSDLEHAMEDHIVAQAMLMGLYSKEN